MKKTNGMAGSRLRFWADGFGAVACGAGGACLVGWSQFGYIDERVSWIGAVAILACAWLVAIGSHCAGVRNGESCEAEDEAEINPQAVQETQGRALDTQA